jgi:hypothetical protein
VVFTLSFWQPKHVLNFRACSTSLLSTLLRVAGEATVVVMAAARATVAAVALVVVQVVTVIMDLHQEQNRCASSVRRLGTGCSATESVLIGTSPVKTSWQTMQKTLDTMWIPHGTQTLGQQITSLVI